MWILVFFTTPYLLVFLQSLPCSGKWCFNCSGFTGVMWSFCLLTSSVPCHNGLMVFSMKSVVTSVKLESIVCFFFLFVLSQYAQLWYICLYQIF